MQNFRPAIYKRIAGAFFAAMILVICAQADVFARGVVSYHSSLVTDADVILDSRPASLCEQASLKDAQCLAARDFLGPHKRLSNFSGILWLLGTAGLKGDEHVLIVGDKSADKEFVAGLLFITGQRKISILIPPVSSFKDSELLPGEMRDQTRSQIYRAEMRADHILLRSDMVEMLSSANVPVILDGRSEHEYWGQRVRTKRGGHIPGAQHLPAAVVNTAQALLPVNSSKTPLPVAYGHDSYEGLVYLTRLTGKKLAARLYLEGWAGWASDGALDADSVTYPDLKVRRGVSVQARGINSADKKSWLVYGGFGIGAIALSLGGFIAGRSSRRITG